jgi:hypothetical protein
MAAVRADDADAKELNPSGLSVGRTAGGQEATSSRKTSKGSSLTLTAAILEVEEFLTRRSWNRYQSGPFC